MNIRHRLMLASLAAFMSAAAASAADTANPTFANPDTPGLLDGRPSPDAANVTDVVFVKMLTFGSRGEVELGKRAMGEQGLHGSWLSSGHAKERSGGLSFALK